MSKLTRDGTAEPVSRDQILRHARGQGDTIFPVQLTTSRIGNLTRLIHTLLYVMTIHTYIQVVRSRAPLPPKPGSGVCVWEGLSGGCRAGHTLIRWSQMTASAIQPVG